MEQMTIQEISKITQITTYTLSRDIKKALVRLKEQLQKQ
jgi:DNA-directed RNA polymerase specialized sigma24 family protein